MSVRTTVIVEETTVSAIAYGSSIRRPFVDLAFTSSGTHDVSVALALRSIDDIEAIQTALDNARSHFDKSLRSVG